MPGIDQYTKLLLHFSGSEGDKLLYDSVSETFLTSSFYSSSIIKTDFKFTSSYSSVTGSQISSASISSSYPIINYGSSDWTIDFWMKWTCNIGGINPITYAIGTGYIYTDDAISLVYNNGWFHCYQTDTTGSSAYTSNNARYVFIPDNTTWHHYAFIRSGSTIRMYQDGTQKDSITAVSLFPNAIPRYIGRNLDFQTSNIDELRISQGIARWTSSFTPPSSEYTSQFRRNISNITSSFYTIALIGAATQSSIDITSSFYTSASIIAATTTQSSATIDSEFTQSSNFNVYHEHFGNTSVTSSFNTDVSAFSIKYYADVKDIRPKFSTSGSYQLLSNSTSSINLVFTQSSILTNVGLPSTDIQCVFTQSSEIVNLVNVNFDTTASFDNSASLYNGPTCNISCEFFIGESNLKLPGAQNVCVNLYMDSGSGSDTYNFNQSLLLTEFSQYDPINQLWEFPAGANGTIVTYDEYIQPVAVANNSGWYYNLQTQMKYNSSLYGDNIIINSASLFLYQTASGNTPNGIGQDEYLGAPPTHPVSHSLAFITASTGWIEIKLNSNGINYINTSSYTEISLGIFGRFTTQGYGASIGTRTGDTYVSSNHSDSSLHPYFRICYSAEDLDIRNVSSSIVSAFNTRTAVYGQQRPNPAADPNNDNIQPEITQVDAVLTIENTNESVFLNGNCPMFVVTSSLTEVVLCHSVLDPIWFDSNEIKHESVINGDRYYVISDDNSEFSLNVNIFKEEDPAAKLDEIMSYKNNLVYFYPDSQGLPIYNIFRQPAEFFISEIKPYYLTQDATYDAVKITFKSTRQTWFGTEHNLGYGFLYATRYGVRL